MQQQFQTLSQFLRSPFNTGGDLEKDKKYSSLYEISGNKIKVEGFTEIEGSYYVHVKIPSESKSDKKYTYDVVIRFFTDREDVRKQDNLRAYYIQFFSNSPSFIYKYAALYKHNGFLIEKLQDKLDQEYADVMPSKTNNKMELYYDKSIYFACRKLSELKFRILNKRGMILSRKKSPEKFFQDISDFKSVKLDQELITAEKQLKKAFDNKRKHKRDKDTHIKKKNITAIKTNDGSIFKSKRIVPKPKITSKAKVVARGKKKKIK